MKWNTLKLISFIFGECSEPSHLSEKKKRIKLLFWLPCINYTSGQSNCWWEKPLLDRFRLVNEEGMIEIEYDHFTTL